MYCNVVTAIDKIPTYLLCFNSKWPSTFDAQQEVMVYAMASL